MNVLWQKGDCTAKYTSDVLKEETNELIDKIYDGSVDKLFAAPAGILHVTIPVTNPTAYTVQPAGDFKEQQSSAFWFSISSQIGDTTYVYSADVCKEMDTEAIYTLQNVIDYMETICTPGFAEELRKEHLGMASLDCDYEPIETDGIGE